MNYLELINKCLVELNYKEVSDFSELTKYEHKKLRNILNVLNAEICSSERWQFLLKKTQITLPKGSGEIKNTVNGRIEAIIVDGVKFEYFEDFEKFFVNSQPDNTFSFFNDNILFPIFDKDKTVEILYYSRNYAKDKDGVEKANLDDSKDISVIPAPFAEPLLTYGACLRLKGNPQHIRFNYWLSMYKDALANLRSRVSSSVDGIPSVKMYRK